MNEAGQFLLGHRGPVLFAVVLIEQAGLPVPAAPWLLAAGALSAAGKLNPVLALGLTALACVLADSAWFYIGRRGGQRVLRLFCRLSLAPNACVGRSQGLFGRHGMPALVASKFIPGLGTVMPPLAGALGVGTGRFLVFDSLGSLLYGSVYISAGFIFHNQLQRIVLVLGHLGFSALLLGFVAVLAYVAIKYYRRRQTLTREGPRAEPGVEGTRRPSASRVAAQILDEQGGSLERESIGSAVEPTGLETPPSSFAQAEPSGV